MNKRILYIVLTIIIILGIFFNFRTSNAEAYTSEEASPIREKDEIVGMDYSIDIEEGTNKDTLVIDTAILSSINHYKDIDSIDSFFIDLKINNKSDYKYLLKNININNISDLIVKRVDYKIDNNIVTFDLNKEDLSNDNYIQIELEK